MSTTAPKQTKPSPDFPLTWHPSGYWCKKVNGKLHYFGQRNSTPQVALAEWIRDRDYILAGAPRPSCVDGMTLKQGLNRFLNDRDAKVKRGDLTQRSMVDYQQECKAFLEVVGGSRQLSSITPTDFKRYRDSMIGVPPTIAGRVSRMRVAFRWLVEMEFVEKVTFGPEFKLPTAKSMRLHRETLGKRMFSAAQVKLLIDNASDGLKGAIVLGLNAAFGNSDIERVRVKHLDGEFHCYAREKTGIKRRCWLWPETLELLDLSGDRLFNLNAQKIDRDFRALRDSLGMTEGFYSLRRTFATIASDTLDQPAIDLVMGHSNASMSALYRQEVSDDRVKAVCSHVRDWYLKEVD